MLVDPPGTQIFIPGEIITKKNSQYVVMNTEARLTVQAPETTLFDNLGHKKAERFAHAVVAF